MIHRRQETENVSGEGTQAVQQLFEGSKEKRQEDKKMHTPTTGIPGQEPVKNRRNHASSSTVHEGCKKMAAGTAADPDDPVRTAKRDVRKQNTPDRRSDRFPEPMVGTADRAGQTESRNRIRRKGRDE